MKITMMVMVLSLAVSAGRAQPAPAHESFWGAVVAPADGAHQDDPGYELYREGYRHVLDEQWGKARELFQVLRQRYPASEYVDDAAYWAAYALKEMNPAEAGPAYRAFIEQYRMSSYLDDAVADLQEIEMASWQRSQNGVVVVGRPRLMVPGLQKLERELRRASRSYRRMGVPMMIRVDEDLDAETRIRMEALYAIGETTRDDQAFHALRRVAVDRAEPGALREAALEVLVGFPGEQSLPVLLEVARKDTSQQLQSYAVDLIAESPVDTVRKVTALIDLYRSVPHSRREQRQAIFYTIADIGTDRAVTFLGEVALNSPDDDARREAVYYLGSIGGPEARSVLMKVLLQK